MTEVVTGQQVWTLAMKAPAPWINANDTINRFMRAEYVARWRAAAFVGAARAMLPKGLAKVRIEPVLHFMDRRRRDAPNLHPTLKACVDGLGPAFLRMPSARYKGASAPGYGLIPDDDAKHLDLREPVIGEPYPEVAKAIGVPLGGQWGALVLTITDLSEETTDAE